MEEFKAELLNKIQEVISMLNEKKSCNDLELCAMRLGVLDESAMGNDAILLEAVDAINKAVHLHGQVRAVCSRPVVSLLWNVVVRPHLRCVRAACCGLSSHGCYSLLSDLPQTVATGLQQRCWKQICCRPVVTELQLCCCGQNCSRL